MNFSAWLVLASTLFFQNQNKKPSINSEQYADALRNYWDGITAEHQSLLWRNV